MGTFLVNFHLRSQSSEQLSATLRKIPIENGWMAGPQGQWITFWEREASQQNTDRIQFIARFVAESLKTSVIAFLVHDSDYLCYWLYDREKLLDEYNSSPEYWEDKASVESTLAADYQLLAKYCLPGTDPGQLEKLLAQSSIANMTEGDMPTFTFAELHLEQLAPLLGIRDDLLLTDYRDIGPDVDPGEIGAVWIGSSEQPHPETDVHDEEIVAYKRLMASAPLHQAAAKDDIAAIEELIASGRDINEVAHPYTITALAMAAAEGNESTIRTLVALGADLHKMGPEGGTPLRLAVQSFRADNIRVLVDLGANINEYDSELGTLLHIATTHPSPEVIRVLLELGLDSKQENPSGLTPLDILQAEMNRWRQTQTMCEESVALGVANIIHELEDMARMLQDASG